MCKEVASILTFAYWSWYDASHELPAPTGVPDRSCSMILRLCALQVLQAWSDLSMRSSRSLRVLAPGCSTRHRRGVVHQCHNPRPALPLFQRDWFSRLCTVGGLVDSSQALLAFQAQHASRDMTERRARLSAKSSAAPADHLSGSLGDFGNQGNSLLLSLEEGVKPTSMSDDLKGEIES